MDRSILVETKVGCRRAANKGLPLLVQRLVNWLRILMTDKTSYVRRTHRTEGKLPLSLRMGYRGVETVMWRTGKRV